jgi:hypothetical protein
MTSRIVGLPWFEPENFHLIRVTCDIPHTIKPTYAAWRAGAEQVHDKLIAAGCQVIKVDIDPHTFPQWCARNSLTPDTVSRMQYAKKYVEERKNQPGRVD